MKQLILLVLGLILYGCSTNETLVKKYQKDRSNIVDITSLISPIDINELQVSSAIPKISNDKLVLFDYRSNNNIIHILDKINFNYLYSGIRKGRSSDELIVPGGFTIDETTNSFFISDFGKRKILKYNIDSLINSHNYSPSLKRELDKEDFPNEYQYINDTLCYGVFVELFGNKDFDQYFAAWNMNTGDIYNKHQYSPIEGKKRICGTVNINNDIIIEAYTNNDILIISDINGNPKFVIYGPQAHSAEQKFHFSNIIIYNNYIIASYSGKNYQEKDGFSPNQLHVFDFKGNYIKTLYSDLNISHFCIDKESDRLILSFNDDELQLGYIELNNVI